MADRLAEAVSRGAATGYGARCSALGDDGLSPTRVTWFNPRVDAPLHDLTRSRVRRLTVRDEPVLRRFLARSPSQHAYLLGQLARGALSDPNEPHTFVGWFERGVLAAAASLGPNLVISRCPALRGAAVLATFAAELGNETRVVVGPDREVDVFMGQFGREGVRLERVGQVLLELDGRHLVRSARSIGLRPAQPLELDAVWHLDHDMIMGELGFSPFANDPQLHRQGCLRRIQERRTWVEGPSDGSVVFKVDQSAVSPEVVQLAGVYTAPNARRLGLAFGAVGEMCHLLLREVPRVSLYVNEDNSTARRLYGRLGFREVGRVRSIWLDPP